MAVQNQVAIVTGGVSGIGEGITLELARRGWNVAAFDIPRQKPLADGLAEKLGAAFMFVPCDVSKYAELASGFSEVFARWGRIDAFCANAGIIDKSSVYIFAHRGKKDVPPEPDLSTTDVCYKGVVYGTQLAVHFMRQNPTPGGFIIATSSAVALYPVASLPEYTGAKAAVNGFVEACAPILKFRENITINSVCPGVVATQFVNQEMRGTFGDGLTPRSTIVAAYMKCLDDRSLNGEFVEASRDQLLVVKKLDYADGEVSKRTTTVYDPLFVTLHGEPSRLQGCLNPQS